VGPNLNFDEGNPTVLVGWLQALAPRLAGGIRIFKSRTGAVDSAQGIDRLRIVVRRDGALRLVVSGRRTALRAPPRGGVRITVGVYDPGTSGAGNRCASAVGTFRASRNDELKFP
jgi:hypothetical protein